MKNAEKKTVKSQKSLQPRVCKANKTDTFLDNRYVLIQIDKESGEEFEVFCTSYFHYAFELTMKYVGPFCYHDLLSFKRSVLKGEYNFIKSMSSFFYLSCLRDDGFVDDKKNRYILHLEDDSTHFINPLCSSHDIFDILKYLYNILDVDDCIDLVPDILNLYFHGTLPNVYNFTVANSSFILSHYCKVSDNPLHYE